MIDRVLEHLEALVGFDSSEPPATIRRDCPIVAYVAEALVLAGLEVKVEDIGGGCVNVFGTRGDPETLFNCHLDTVKPDPKWLREPFELAIDSGKAYGLGACDIKGAAACMLAAVEATDDPIAVLFTTDEEAGKGRCIEHFVRKRQMAPAVVVVAEPTSAAPVTQHRGFTSFELTFSGSAGHTSASSASERSALHKAIRWGDQALTLAEPGGPLHEARFNIGVIAGGTASNVIASSAYVRFGFRPSPGPRAAADTEAAVVGLRNALPSDGSAEWTDRFLAPPLTATDDSLAAIEAWGLERAPDVDFWTEAALFASAGMPTVVIGPGDIAQAHAADEFVEVDQLALCAGVYRSIIEAGAGSPAGQGASNAS
ncbi:MAG: acetylornithine deacetylase [Phycisphaerae bacterium]|nr:acetylornithine deacetylase [Phycisphaerae bacterium]